MNLTREQLIAEIRAAHSKGGRDPNVPALASDIADAILRADADSAPQGDIERLAIHMFAADDCRTVEAAELLWKADQALGDDPEQEKQFFRSRARDFFAAPPAPSQGGWRGIESAPRESEAERLLKALRLALPILDDDLCSYRSDTPPARWDKRAFVCLDDLHDCEHSRWLECQATLTALAAIRDILPADEWEAETYETTQKAIEHFAPSSTQRGEG